MSSVNFEALPDRIKRAILDAGLSPLKYTSFNVPGDRSLLVPFNEIVLLLGEVKAEGDILVFGDLVVV